MMSNANYCLLLDLQNALWNHIETADVVVPGAVELRNEVDILLSEKDGATDDDVSAILAKARAIGAIS